ASCGGICSSMVWEGFWRPFPASGRLTSWCTPCDWPEANCHDPTPGSRVATDVVADLAAGGGVPGRAYRTVPVVVSLAGERQPARPERAGCWFHADRTGFHIAGVFSWATVVSGSGIRRGGIGGVQPGADQRAVAGGRSRRRQGGLRRHSAAGPALLPGEWHWVRFLAAAGSFPPRRRNSGCRAAHRRLSRTRRGGRSA